MMGLLLSRIDRASSMAIKISQSIYAIFSLLPNTVMTQDVAQWLAEIQSLQQQLAQLQEEYAAAQASTDRWRELYNQEAEQRRQDTKTHQETIRGLQAELEQLKQGGTSPEDRAAIQRQLIQELNLLPTDEIKQKLFEAIEQIERTQGEVDRLQSALTEEQTAHEQTRKSLTTALGDTVELLTQARSGKKKKRSGPSLPGAAANANPDEEPSSNSTSLTASDSIKNPLLQLPPLE